MSDPGKHAAPLDMEFSIVSGSNPQLLLDCLASLDRTMAGSSYRWCVTVTCNGGGPELPQRIRGAHPHATIIENDSSRGFAENHNVVLRASRARYVWLLNDDLVLLDDTVARVTAFMDDRENKKVAVVSPKLLNPDGSLQPSTYGFPTMPQIMLAHSGMRDNRVTRGLLRAAAPVLRPRAGSSRFWHHDKTIVVDTLRGACVAVRMDAVREVGVMVEVARVGGEETEWHRRFRDAGWQVVYFADASVIHFGSQTVRAGDAEHYPEYLKGSLYFFRAGNRVSYRLFCTLLIGMFGARALFNRVTGDQRGYELALRYGRVAREGLAGDRSAQA